MFNYKGFLSTTKKMPRRKVMTKHLVDKKDQICSPAVVALGSEYIEPPDINGSNAKVQEKTVSYRMPRDLANRDEDEREDRRYEGASYQQLVLEGIVFKYF